MDNTMRNFSSPQNVTENIQKAKIRNPSMKVVGRGTIKVDARDILENLSKTKSTEIQQSQVKK